MVNVRSSCKFKRVMQTIVTHGNALNQGTTRGQYFHCLFYALLLGSDWIAFCCRVLVDKLPELLDFSKDLDSLEPASKVQLKYLAEEMQAISKGLEKLSRNCQWLKMMDLNQYTTIYVGNLSPEEVLFLQILLKLRIIIKQKPCLGVGPLCNAQQVKLMEERNMKPLDLNLAALSARCSKDMELNLAKSLLSEMGQYI
uniref:FH2 domain-containing protein n=1 Tax=Lactuca sativa TaxID=4236 RepID=A0A9R1VWT8_LACSA|nr:hypothetical protein LSAT_V11C400225180 [Lactuca sativa]